MSGLIEDATGNDLTYRIIGAAIAVHNALGPGFKEQVYERALVAELAQHDIEASSQVSFDVEYEGVTVASFYVDLLVEEMVVVELKAMKQRMTDSELAQVISYLKATHAPVGLLFNFGRQRLEFRRVFPGRR